MPSVRRVLFPVEFSLSDQMLAATVRQMTERWRAEVTLLHVMESRCGRAHAGEVVRLMDRLQEVARHEVGTGSARRRVESGSPAGRIIEYARDNQVDVVVMAARGSAALRRKPLGRVAAEVLEEAPCAVWLDWGSAFAGPASGMQARHVCCVIGLEEAETVVLSRAAELAAELGAAMTIVHAVVPEPARPDAPWNQAARDRAVWQARMRIDGLRSSIAQDAEVRVEVGAREEVIARAVRDTEAGLLVTGGGRETVLAAEPACPVLRVARSAWRALEVPLRRTA